LTAAGRTADDGEELLGCPVFRCAIVGCYGRHGTTPAGLSYFLSLADRFVGGVRRAMRLVRVSIDTSS
jgi:hypothetical protein